MLRTGRALAADKRQVCDLPEPQPWPHDLHVAHLASIFSVAAVVGMLLLECVGGVVRSSTDSTNTDDVKSLNGGETFRHIICTTRP